MYGFLKQKFDFKKSYEIRINAYALSKQGFLLLFSVTIQQNLYKIFIFQLHL